MSNQFWGKIENKPESDAVYWVKVMADGSGDYSISSIKEEKMKQEVAVTAAEINNNMKEDGKAVSYGIFFDTDKSTLKPESAPTLTELSKFLLANPSTNVFIVGHTDNAGDFIHNLTLAKDRASAVVAELVGKYGVNKTQVTPQGVASLAPLASNETENGRAKNRRVEIVNK